MDNGNWRSAQPEPEAPDWRTQLQPDSRSRIVNKIMETLKKHLPISGPEGLHELQKIAIRFEERIYAAALSQSDYLRKISLKMLTMEAKPPNPNVVNPLQSASTVTYQTPADSGSHGMQPQVRSQGQQMPLSNQTQARQQLLSQNPITSAGIQSSASLSSPVPSGLLNISGISQNSVNNSVGQGVGSNMFANPQNDEDDVGAHYSILAGLKI